MRPETPEEIRARLAKLDQFFRDAGAAPDGSFVSPDEMKRIMARIREAYATTEPHPS